MAKSEHSGQIARRGLLPHVTPVACLEDEVAANPCVRSAASWQKGRGKVVHRIASAIAAATLVAFIGSAHTAGAEPTAIPPQPGGSLQTLLAQAAPPQQQGNQTANSADAAQTQSLGGALGGLLNAVGGALGGNQHVTPVDFRTLQGLLPDALPGMKRSNAGGANKQGMGVKTASAEAEYHGAGSQMIHVSITDISGISGVLDLSGALPKDTDAASDAGYEKDVTVGGYPMHEKYTNAGQQGSLQVIVARRFEVDVDGTGVSMDAVHAAMGRVDLKRLEAMKSQGAQQ